mgnify:CR=1 FL=1
MIPFSSNISLKYLSNLSYLDVSGTTPNLQTVAGLSQLKTLILEDCKLGDWKYNKEIVLMQCNTNYTASEENFKHINLNVLKTYSELFPECVLGLSDHTFGCATVLGAVALGARVFEKHFTDDNSRSGPDHKFAMNPKTWKEMVKEANRLYVALGDGIKKIEENEKESVIVQQRAVYSVVPLKSGDVIKKEDIFPLRPIKANAVMPFDIEKLIGKKIKQDIDKDTCITWEMIEE